LNLNSSKLLITLLIKPQEQEKILLKVAEEDFVLSLKQKLNSTPLKKQQQKIHLPGCILYCLLKTINNSLYLSNFLLNMN